MGRSKVARGDALAIAARLKTFALTRYGTWEAFYKALEISRTTADSWRGRSPSVPDPPFLLLLAREANLNLNWLLLGRGHDLWEYPGTFPGQQLENFIEAQLRHSEDATFEEFNGAWERLQMSNDLTRQEDLVLQLAVEGVRPRLRENLRLVRHYAGIMRVINTFPQVLAEGGKEGKRKAKEFRQALREAFFAEAESIGEGAAPNDDTRG